MYTIVQAPSEILRTPAQPVTVTAPALRKIIAEMKQTLLAQTDPEGVGLAANQIGLPYKLFLARFETKKSALIHVFINPEIVSHSTELQSNDKKGDPLEGCLSIPKYYGVVKRWQWVKVHYQTISNHPTPITNSQSTSKPKLDIGHWPLEIGVGIWIIDCIETFEGFPAIVIQHEMDHLAGYIFVERILEQKGKLYKIIGKDGKKETWDEVEI